MRATLIVLCGFSLTLLGQSAAQPFAGEAGGESTQPGLIRTLSAPPFRHDSPVFCVSATADGKRIVTGTAEGAFLWDVADKQKRRQIANGPISCLAISQNGELVAIGRKADTFPRPPGGPAPLPAITVIESATGKERFGLRHVVARAKIQGHVDGYNCKYSFAGGIDCARALAFSPDGKTLATAIHNDTTIRLWDTSTGNEVTTLEWHENAVHGVAFHPNGKSLFSVSADHTLREWDIATAKEARRLLDRSESILQTLAVSADGTTIAVIERPSKWTDKFKDGARVVLLDTATGKKRFSAVVAGACDAYEVVLSPSGRYVAANFPVWLASTPSENKWKLSAWDTWTGRPLQLDSEDTGFLHSACFLADATMATGGDDCVVRLWDMAKGSQHGSTAGLAGPIGRLAFSPSGKVLASTRGQYDVQLWDTKTGAVLQTLRNDFRVDSLAFSGDGKLLVCAPDQYARVPASVWDAHTGKHLRRLDNVQSPIAFALDGKTLAAADVKCCIRFWDAGKGTELRKLDRHEHIILDLAFSPDGRWLATTDHDGDTFLWNTATGDRKFTLSVKGSNEPRVWFSPDSSLLFVYHSHHWSSGNIHFGGSDGLDVFETITGLPVLEITDIMRRGFQEIWFANGGATLGVATRWGSVDGSHDITHYDLASGSVLGPDMKFGGDFIVSKMSRDRQMMALGHRDGRLLITKPPPSPLRKPTAKITDASVTHLWKALASGDAKAAHQARWLLSGVPQQTLPLLRAELQPATTVNNEQIPAWIAQLDSKSFKEREAATKALLDAGDVAGPSLRKALELNPSPEMRTRITHLLAKIPATPTGDTLRVLRAITILETIGGSESRAILQKLANGAPCSRTTEAAQAALQRVKGSQK